MNGMKDFVKWKCDKGYERIDRITGVHGDHTCSKTEGTKSLVNYKLIKEKINKKPRNFHSEGLNFSR